MRSKRNRGAAFSRAATILGALALCGAAVAGEPPTRKLAFNRDIRPILADKCFRCHGPDKNARKADLRLDRRDSALSDLGEGRHAIVPGDLAASELAKRIVSEDETEIMPPPKAKKPLADAERATLLAWIEQGAEYEPHWAFIAPKKAEPVAETGARTAIDAFILMKLHEQGLKPAPPADAATLARRATFDLAGLPPAPERVEAFAAEPTEDAYRALVDELLASPRFGERMAINWLDQVRYADSNGYHSDEYRSIWPYRDYVINAFNANKPFDQFTVEQLAGDLLANPTREQLIASGFNRLNQITAEGGAQAKEYRAKYNADRVRAVGSVWLGATLGCAECHDHKFDPFTARDFYSFAAFFSDLEEDDIYPGEDDWSPLLRLPSEGQATGLSEIEAKIAELEKTTEKTDTPELRAAARAWEAAQKARGSEALAGWIPERPSKFESAAGCDLALLDDLTILSSGIIPFQETYTVTIATSLEKITGVRLETLTHPSFKKGLTRLRGQFYVNEFEVEAASAGGEPQRVSFGETSDDSTGIGANSKSAIDGDMLTAWYRITPAQRQRQTVTGIFNFAEPIAGGPGTTITVRIRHQGGAMYDRTAFARIRLSLTADAAPKYDAPTTAPEFILRAPDSGEGRSAAIDDAIFGYYRSIAPELADARAQLAEARASREALLKEIPTTLVSQRRPEPRVTRILARGNWQDESGATVDPATPGCLPPMEGAAARATRLDLARWIVSPRNPLTARVYVNRMWKLFFGRGLSKTLEDVGAQGEWPVNPELLDWLAVDFVEHGWDVKRLVRQIVLSEAYRRSSRAGAALREADPDNRWLARQAPERFEAEIVRDTALALGGLLNPEIGGPSVKPYQPEGYWVNLNFPKRVWRADGGPAQYRRGLYVHWQRSFLHPSLKAFDAPSREECVAQRTVSNTPLQALALMNDPTYVEAARAFAARIMREGGESDEARIRWAFRQVLSRAPAEAEAATLLELRAKHGAEYAADPEAAKQAIAVGQTGPPDDLAPSELAAWMSVARTLLNLHEAITRS